MEIVWRRISWWMRLLKMGLTYSRRLWYDQRWKFFLASRSEIQESLSLPALHGGICSHVPSNSD